MNKSRNKDNICDDDGGWVARLYETREIVFYKHKTCLMHNHFFHFIIQYVIQYTYTKVLIKVIHVIGYSLWNYD